MTDLLESSEKDNENNSLSSEFLKTFESYEYIIPEKLNCLKYPFSFEGLSLIECYIKGAVDITVIYNSTSLDMQVAALISAQADISERRISGSIRVNQAHFRHEDIGRDGQNDFMLVSDIEFMEVVESEIPSFVRLSNISNEINDVLMGDEVFLSVNHALYTYPSMTKGKSTIPVRHSSVSFNKNTVSVIERRPEIMDCIAKNGRSMFVGMDGSNRSSKFQHSLLVLGAQDLSVLTDVSLKKDFEILDVLIGPFYLQKGALKVKSWHD